METFLFFFLLLFLSGLFSGVLAGLFGVGGGVIIVPVCLFIFQKMGALEDASMHMAVGTSLATIIPTSYFSTKGHYLKKAVDISAIKLMGPWIIVGVIIGSFLAGFVSGIFLKIIFCVIIFIMGLRLFVKQNRKNMPDVSSGQGTSSYLKKMGGGFIGSLSSLMGIGGGIFSVSILSYFGYKIHKAIGTSAAFGMLIALPGTIGFIIIGWKVDTNVPYTIGYVNLLAFLALLPAVRIGSPLGVKLAHKIPEKILKKLFSILLIIVSLKMFFVIF